MFDKVRMLFVIAHRSKARSSLRQEQALFVMTKQSPCKQGWTGAKVLVKLINPFPDYIEELCSNNSFVFKYVIKKFMLGNIALNQSNVIYNANKFIN